MNSVQPITVAQYGIGPIGAEIQGHHVAFQVDAVSRGGLLTVLYVVATCGGFTGDRASCTG